MNNEKEIEEMAKVMQDTLFQWDSDAHDLTVSLAEILCEKGYGNVKEFAEKKNTDCIKSIDAIIDRIYSRLTEERYTIDIDDFEGFYTQIRQDKLYDVLQGIKEEIM